MSEPLTDQEKVFVKKVVKTGNKTKSVKLAYGIKDDNYAAVKGTRLIRKAKIQNAIKSIADSIPNKDLIRVHKEGLEATKITNSLTSPDMEVPDYAVRHKYMESGYKLKNLYSPDNVNNINITQPIVVVFGKDDLLKKQLESKENKNE